MVNPFICGSFHQQYEDDLENVSPCSTPKRSKKNLSRTKSSNKNNPYSDRGLDKFSALLADIEDKKQRIYSQISPDDISFVRFVYSNSNDVKPIVVKLKDKKMSHNGLENKQTCIERKDSLYKQTIDDRSNQGQERKKVVKKLLKRNISLNYLKWENFKKPMLYLPLTIILILVFLAIYGRSFAIMCTSIGWYLIPSISRENLSSNTSNKSTRNPKRKKEFTRRFSEKSVVKSEGTTSPRSVMNGPIDDKLPIGQHGHRKSWS